VKFGFYLPTCAEGTFYPRGFVDLAWIAQTVQQVEDAGFYEVSASDYVSTGKRTRDDSQPPPRYLEPLNVLAWLAGQTTTIRLLPNVLVMPLRDVVILAKELTTIDQLSSGRLICGLGLGANRDEFESIHPRRKGMDRGQMLDEALEALGPLLTERTASYAGKYIAFNDVELYPKAVQNPLPIFLTGDSEDASRRAGKHADGWITFVPGLAKLESRLEVIDAAAQAAGRPRPSIVPMIGVAVGSTSDAAMKTWTNARFCAHLQGIFGKPGEELAQQNLVGTPGEIATTVAAYANLGVDHMTLVFAGNSTDEVSAQVVQFIGEVMPAIAAT
jgi:probable F420-dependent oxidoreductase